MRFFVDIENKFSLQDCGTQITTLTPTEAIEDIAADSPLPTDDNPVLLADDQVALMPISSGFGYYRYNYPTPSRVSMAVPEIVSRARQVKSSPIIST